MTFSKEMMRALEQDGEYLRQMTGEDHGPVFLSDHDLTCGCCHGSGQIPDAADPYFGTRLEGCPDCQGAGRLLPPGDMSGEPRTLNDMDDEIPEGVG